jgi:serine O-acetyltransferase
MEVILMASERPSFRTIAYYRGRGRERITVRLLRIIAPPLSATEIMEGTKIGAGLHIRHGQGTVIRAESIGEDCEILQQVTIGMTGRGFPVIGDRVDVCAGAIIIGPIHVGNDAVIGAGAVVTKDVPAEGIMVGNPAHQVGTSPAGQRASDLQPEVILKLRSHE